MTCTVACVVTNCLMASSYLILPPGVSTPSVMITRCRLPSVTAFKCSTAAMIPSERRDRLPAESLVLSTRAISSFSVVQSCNSSTRSLNCITESESPSFNRASRRKAASRVVLVLLAMDISPPISRRISTLAGICRTLLICCGTPSSSTRISSVSRLGSK